MNTSHLVHISDLPQETRPIAGITCWEERSWALQVPFTFSRALRANHTKAAAVAIHAQKVLGLCPTIIAAADVKFNFHTNKVRLLDSYG